MFIHWVIHRGTQEGNNAFFPGERTESCDIISNAMLRSKQPRQETNVYSIGMETQRNRKHAWTGIRESHTSSRNDHRDVHRGQVEMRMKRIGHVALPKIYIFLNEILAEKRDIHRSMDGWRNDHGEKRVTRNRVFCFSRNLKEGCFRGNDQLVEDNFVRFSFDFRINWDPIGWPSALEIGCR